MYLKKNLWNVIICIDSQTKPSSKAKVFAIVIIYHVHNLHYLPFDFFLLFVRYSAWGHSKPHLKHVHSFRQFCLNATFTFFFVDKCYNLRCVDFFKSFSFKNTKKKHAEHFCLINEPLNIIIEKQLNKHGKYICFSTCL